MVAVHVLRHLAAEGALTVAEVDTAIRAALDPGKVVWVVVGDAKKVRPQLDGLGLSVETVPAK